MSGESTASELLKNIRIGNSVVKYEQDIYEVAVAYEVTPAAVRKAIGELNRNLKTMKEVWNRRKQNLTLVSNPDIT